MLTCQEPDQDLGGNYFDERERLGVERRLMSRQEHLGYKVALEPAAVTLISVNYATST